MFIYCKCTHTKDNTLHRVRNYFSLYFVTIHHIENIFQIRVKIVMEFIFYVTH